MTKVKAGYCAFGCGKKKSPGKRLCEAHLKSEREKLRDYRKRRKAQGICWRCPNPARPGGMLCEEHRTEVREAEAEQRAQVKKEEKRAAAVEKRKIKATQAS